MFSLKLLRKFSCFLAGFTALLHSVDITEWWIGKDLKGSDRGRNDLLPRETEKIHDNLTWVSLCHGRVSNRAPAPTHNVHLLPPVLRSFHCCFLYCVERCRESKPEQVWILWSDYSVQHLTSSLAGPHPAAKISQRPPDSIIFLLPAPRSLLAKLFPDLTRGIQ